MSVDLPVLPPPAELAERKQAEKRFQAKAAALAYLAKSEAHRVVRIWQHYGPRSAAYLTRRRWTPFTVLGHSHARRLTLGERLALAVFGGAW